ncbi:MAG: hypothetical protein OXF99_00775 [bacterium]|nr:hypothetical protein [bacterium]
MSRLEFDRADSRALRAVAAQFFVNGTLFASFVPRLPEIRDRVEISVAGVGALLSTAGVYPLTTRDQSRGRGAHRHGVLRR